MSIQAISWVFSQDIRPSNIKFVLLALADNTNNEGTCWPSVAAISSKTSQDRKTVISALRTLEEMGLLIDTGERVGRTKQVKVYRLNGLPTDERHYVYKLTRADTGEFYIGVRSTIGEVVGDGYMGSGLWPVKMMREKVPLQKEVIREFSTRAEAEIEELRQIKECANNILCRNKLNNTGYGTLRRFQSVPAADGKEYRLRMERVPQTGHGTIREPSTEPS
jgi:hypothetical protein